MAENVVDISMAETMRQVTIQVRCIGRRRWKVRVWLGTQVMKLAAMVMGCGVEVVD